MAFVVTSGTLQSVQRPHSTTSSEWASGWSTAPGGWSPHRSVQLTPTLTVTYEQLWRSQPAIRTVVGFLARNVAQLSVDPYRRISATDRVKATDHPLARLLENPVDGSAWNKYRLLNTLMHDLGIYDNAFWLKMRGDGGVRAIQPMPAGKMETHGKNALWPDFYRYRGPNGYVDFPPDQVVHFHGYNPDDPRTGCAPIETLRQILAEEYAGGRYREQMWRNGARIAGYISRPEGAPNWSPEARERFRGDWQQQYTGDGPATGGTPILEDGMTFQGSAVTPKDAQWIEGRRLTREEVAVAYHVSPVMLGLMEGAGVKNVAELHKMLYQDTLPPYFVSIAQDIETQLLTDVDPQGAKTGSVYVEFNIKGKLAGSFEEQAQALQSSVGGPWMTRDEARAMHNLPHVDGADELIVPLNVIAGGLASPNDTAPDNPSNEASNGQLPKADVLRRFFNRQAKAVQSAMAAGATDPADLVPARWDAELAANFGCPVPVAAVVNDVTRERLAGAAGLAAVTDVYADLAGSRADTIAADMEEATR